jgi:hypothetical protein
VHQFGLQPRELRERSFAVYFLRQDAAHHRAGACGYCVARPALTRELRKVHQFNYLQHAATPLQEGIQLVPGAIP